MIIVCKPKYNVTPPVETLVINNGGVGSFRSSFWSKTLSKYENHGQPFTYTGTVTKIGFGLTSAIGNSDCNYEAYIYDGNMIGDGSTNILLGTSTNKIHSSAINPFNDDFWYFNFNNIITNNLVTVVVRSVDVVIMNDNNYDSYRSIINAGSTGTNIARTVPYNWHTNSGLDSWLRVYALV